jgi:hypothetical protein
VDLDVKVAEVVLVGYRADAWNAGKKRKTVRIAGSKGGKVG